MSENHQQKRRAAGSGRSLALYTAAESMQSSLMKQLLLGACGLGLGAWVSSPRPIIAIIAIEGFKHHHHRMLLPEWLPGAAEMDCGGVGRWEGRGPAKDSSHASDPSQKILG